VFPTGLIEAVPGLDCDLGSGGDNRYGSNGYACISSIERIYLDTEQQSDASTTDDILPQKETQEEGKSFAIKPDATELQYDYLGCPAYEY
jgi:hypothetical protein